MLDFKNFQKVSEDKDSVTMKHKDGHEIRVAMKALPKIQQDQIRSLKLAKGGAVHRKKFDDGGAAEQDDPSVQSPADSADVAPAENPAAQMATEQIPDANIKAPAELPNLNSDGQPNAANVLKNTQAAGDLGAQIDSAKAKQQAVIDQGAIDQRAKLQQIEQQNYNDLKKHTDDFAKYNAQNPIDPKHYQENMGAGTKVANAIGLFLGGFKQGVVGGNNPAMDFLNQQIDRDIAGQKARADQQKTVWGAYKDLYGEGLAANAATKATMLDIYKHQVDMAAAKLGTVTAKRNAMLFNTDATIKQQQLLRDGAGDIHAYPGTHGGTAPGGQPDGTGQAAPVGPEDAYRHAGVDPNDPDRDAKLRAQGKDPAQYVQNYQNFANKPKPVQPVKDDDHILVPNSDDVFKRMQYDPTSAKSYDQIREQKSKAALADKAIDVINDVYPKLEAETGGAGGYLRHQGDALGGIPYVGDAISGAGHFITDTPENRSYDSDYSQLVGSIRGALQGNVSEDLLDKTVRANAPEVGDTPELRAKKLAALKDFIKSHTKTDLLGPLMKRRK